MARKTNIETRTSTSPAPMTEEINPGSALLACESCRAHAAAWWTMSLQRRAQKGRESAWV